MSAGLADTSVIVFGDELADQLPELLAISVITIGELRAGVLRAKHQTDRSQREARLEAVRAVFDPLPVDQHVALRYGDLLAWARDHSRAEKATDLLIVATAAASKRRLLTLDKAQASLARGADVPATLLIGRADPGRERLPKDSPGS